MKFTLHPPAWNIQIHHIFPPFLSAFWPKDQFLIVFESWKSGRTLQGITSPSAFWNFVVIKLHVITWFHQAVFFPPRFHSCAYPRQFIVSLQQFHKAQWWVWCRFLRNQISGEILSSFHETHRLKQMNISYCFMLIMGKNHSRRIRHPFRFSQLIAVQFSLRWSRGFNLWFYFVFCIRSITPQKLSHEINEEICHGSFFLTPSLGMLESIVIFKLDIRYPGRLYKFAQKS